MIKTAFRPVLFGDKESSEGRLNPLLRFPTLISTIVLRQVSEYVPFVKLRFYACFSMMLRLLMRFIYWIIYPTTKGITDLIEKFADIFAIAMFY